MRSTKDEKRIPVGFLIVALALALAGGMAVAVQWKKTLLLRADLAVLQTQTGELQRLRAENERLKAQQIPPGDLEKLREDHKAVMRLRAELEALQKRAVGAAN